MTAEEMRKMAEKLETDAKALEGAKGKGWLSVKDHRPPEHVRLLLWMAWAGGEGSAVDEVRVTATGAVWSSEDTEEVLFWRVVDPPNP